MGIYGYSVALITASAVAIFISIRHIEQNFQRQFNLLEIILKPMICCVFMAYIMSKAFLPLVNLDFPKIICIGADLILGISGYLILALALGIDLRGIRQRY
jgi:O-antigen/teichoic acid export membrane protein